MRRRHFGQSHNPAGFTLLELLGVLAIIIIVSAAVVPSLTGITGSSSLTTGSSMFADALNLARQTALADNCPVEVRIYKTGSAANPSDPQYCAFNLFKVDDSNAKQALGKLRRLPDPIIISPSSQYSSLMAGRSGNSAVPEDYPMPKDTPYIWFRFKPNGSTDLTPVEGPGSNWFVTLVSRNAPIKANTGLPANYFTIQIDPTTGRARSYRP